MTAVATEDYLAQYRRKVTPEDAGMAMCALAAHRRNGKSLDAEHYNTLMALAVEAHAPKEETRNAER